MAHSHLEGGTGMQMVCSGHLNMPVRMVGAFRIAMTPTANLIKGVTMIGGMSAAVNTMKTSSLQKKTAVIGTSSMLLATIVHDVQGTSRNNKEGTTALTFTGIGDLTGTTGIP